MLSRIRRKTSGTAPSTTTGEALDNFLEITKAAGVTKLDDVEIETVDLFRTKRPIAAATWVKELAILRNFFGFCVSRKWMTSNPGREVKAPTASQSRKNLTDKRNYCAYSQHAITWAEAATSEPEPGLWCFCFATPVCVSATWRYFPAAVCEMEIFTCTP